MASAQTEHIEETPKWSLWPRRRRWRALILVLSLLGIAGVWVWMAREQYAGNFIDGELAKLELPADYEIVSIGPQRQVLRNLVIGDPERPDLTIERVVVDLEYSFGAPSIGTVKVIGARLYGSYREGELSFGALDEAIFGESDAEPGLPEIDVKLVDARGLIESDYGAIGIKASGQGLLSDGFEGALAATAPELAIAECSLEAATLFGDVTTSGGELEFDGPLRLRTLDCANGGPQLASADVATRFTLASDFASADGELDLAAEQLAVAGAGASTLGGDVQLSWKGAQLNVRHDLRAQNAVTPFGAVAGLSLEGTLRAQDGFDALEWAGRLEGKGASIGGAFTEQLRASRSAVEGTLLEPLLARFQQGFGNATRDGTVIADATLRVSPEVTSLIVPEARLKSASGETLLGLSRLAWTSPVDGLGRLSGNIATSGEGIPRISGRMEQVGGGNLALRLRMEEFAAGDSKLAVPELLVTQAPSGALRFAGDVRASGALPGGSLQGLSLPLEGTWSPRGGLIAGQSCANVRFDRLALYDLALDRQSLRLCPGAGGAMVRYDENLQISAQLPSLALRGQIAGSPLLVDTGAVQFGYPGVANASNVEAVIGTREEGLSLSLGNLEASFADTIGGAFSDGEAMIGLVPLDLDEVSGNWLYADGILSIDEAQFRVTDREAIDRFEPLIARDAVMVMNGSDIRAEALLRHPATDREVVAVEIAHSLSTSAGNARLDVERLAFDDTLQPSDLTIYTDGVVALAKGDVSGQGQINWTADDITSGGIFTTEQFDFAAAFGPVKNARATVEFTDLLALTTAPDQIVDLGSINTGIEVLDGKITYALEEGQLVKLKDARWPFMGGELVMRGVDLNFAVPEERRYIFEIIGLDAGTFISEMEFGNLSAQGTFDGTIPIIFDAEGNGRIESGLLISRPPGGNLSYVGELAYEDLGTISNYAFDALRSLDYNQMAITMDGSLTGEIITSVRFDGISQGQGTSRNFITKQIARLPIRFNINVRSQFWELSRLLRSTYDSNYLRDPCLTSDPKWRASRFFKVACQNTPDINPEDIPASELSIQPQESENTP